RAGSGTLLIDPAVLPDLSAVGAVLEGVEWVLHAATQDLPCLADVGMRPTRLFDTELASRLAGLPRVGLAAAVEELLGLSLAKEHSAVDWSVRPLPEPWLRYAALDVEVLIDLRDALGAELERQGKLEWARQEFEALVGFAPAGPRNDPWRRTSGMHRLRTRRQLAIVRELWNARDELARAQDVSPGRIIPDSSIVEAAMAQPAGRRALMAMSTFTGRGSRRYADVWADAVGRALELPEADLPPPTLPAEGPPPARVWGDRDPAAAARLARARAAVAALAAQHTVPVENLLSPDVVRRLSWAPPQPADEAAVRAFLAERGARPWQIFLTAAALAAALTG
ncbi:MAG TPA: HRDC domain-containing protein, partial [Kineosporiaceae bacterium]|nr:HRDC domain-containing protein [Kineosporiaceae bacterium]